GRAACSRSPRTTEAAMTARQINEPIQDTAGGFADTAADAPDSKIGLAGKRRSWLGWILSDNPPGGALLNALVLVILVVLLFAPFLFPGSRAINVASLICIFIILVASYDLMLGFTGIVSFAHTMFFGIGAYGVAIALAKGVTGWTGVLVGTLAG